ncbi:hypothetical protein SAMN05444395_105161 [Flavobacterium fryxellicola]|uniref:Uncharacterized protein n=1 Tax=Flavobacterium fryxellicola TaxID=249352 RepID=A0A167WRS2_9FLAO|nr:hypothetical protein [Flavobacterium fryxellicola]OAB27679.1 hypothetical protein FBFR_10930 [Flavobacterium fryxellicola]SHN70090.1 hypothetical protein SAMN05444395_105161 [Flavobacterium fryxellicola]
MNYQITIKKAYTVDEIEGYWTSEDYIKLLEKFDYPDAGDADPATLKELLFMAISDFEPKDAAVIALEYKLSENLNEGQIQQVSNDMLLDKVCEEYPEIGLHATLFHINQLLFKAYNGTFPNAKATIIECSFEPLEEESEIELTKESILKLLNNGLSGSNLIKRLFDLPMTENLPFPEAEAILWEVRSTDNSNFTIITSEYWLSKEDIIASEFEGILEIALDVE